MCDPHEVATVVPSPVEHDCHTMPQEGDGNGAVVDMVSDKGFCLRVLLPKLPRWVEHGQKDGHLTEEISTVLRMFFDMMEAARDTATVPNYDHNPALEGC